MIRTQLDGLGFALLQCRRLDSIPQFARLVIHRYPYHGLMIAATATTRSAKASGAIAPSSRVMREL